MSLSFNKVNLNKTTCFDEKLHQLLLLLRAKLLRVSNIL